MSTYSNDEWVDRILSGIYTFNSRGLTGRAQRNTECDNLLKTYFLNCDYSDEKSNATLKIFSDTLDIIVEAIECYRIGHFNASMVMIRNAIDASTYTSLCYDLQLDQETKKVHGIVPIGSIRKYKKYKDLNVRKKKIVNQKLLAQNEVDELYEIRKSCNFSAHIYEIKQDIFFKKFPNFLEEALTGKRTSGDPLSKQQTTEKENQSNLNRAINLLMKLHMNYVHKSGML